MNDLVDIIVGALVQYIFYWPGRIILLILSLGHYPPARTTKHNEEFVALIGFLSTCIMLLTIALMYET